MYPRPGRYWRVLGLANDVADGEGETRAYLRSELTNAGAMAWSGTHSQVAPGVDSPLNVADPSEASVTPTQRMLLPFYAAYLRRCAAVQRVDAAA